MNRDELDLKGAKAMMAQFNPGGVPDRWTAWADRAYRSRATVVIDAVEADIRADERKRIVRYLDQEAAAADRLGAWNAAALTAGHARRIEEGKI
jgi:hypothetical protein